METDPLTSLAIKHGTDKAQHRYTSLYAKLFEPMRTRVKKVLEIGVDYGNSLRLWRDDFSAAEIHGIDIHQHCLDYENSVTYVHLGEQQDTEFLGRLCRDHGPFDIIIDDGSHDPHHQLVSFQCLFKYGLADNGIYIVEDLHDAAAFTKLADMKSLIDHVNYFPPGARPCDWAANEQPAGNYYEKHLVSITFYRFLCVLQKGDNEKSSR